jgi:Na+-driven multidrug efflux pump
MLSYTGQNYGAKNIDRIKHGIKDAIVIDLIFYSIVLIISQIIAKNVAYIFLPKEEINDDIIFYCSSYIKIITPFLICQGLLQISRSILQGIKKTIIPFISGIGELLARIFICLLIPTLINPSNPISNESYLGICFSTPLAWVTSLLIMGGSVIYIIYFKGIKFENSINK